MFGVVLYGYAKESEKNQDPSRADWIDKNFPVVILQLIAFLENKRYTPVPQTDCSEHTWRIDKAAFDQDFFIAWDKQQWIVS